MTQDNQNNQSEAQVPKDQTGLATSVTEQEHQQAQADNVITHDPLSSEYNPNQIPNNDADKRLNMKFGDKFLNNWNENGIFRVMVVICGFVFILVLIGIFKFFFGGSNVPDQVDGSKTKFDAPQTNAGEAEVVTQEQYQYIRAQEAILAQRAKEKGESYTPRNLVIAQGTGTGQAVLPTTSNAANGVSADQVNGTLFNSTQGLNYNGANSQGQQGQQGQVQQTQSQYAQPQYIQIPDNASPIANQYVQNNNEFASWYEQESQRQISENENVENCYMNVVAKDSTFLSYKITNGNVLGKLKYKNFEKDSSSGEISGTVSGDTLKINYKFSSEGSMSEREIYFLQDSGVLLEGIGKYAETSTNKAVYESTKSINFTKGQRLNPADCKMILEKLK